MISSGSDSTKDNLKPTSTPMPALSHIPPQVLIPINQYKYLFPLEDETAPQYILNHILNTSIPVSVKDLFVVLPDICKHFHDLITIKQVTTNAPATTATVAQTTVPMFACFALNSILCNRTLAPSKPMSV